MSDTIEIPIFPLDTVLYPDGRLPLRIFEVRYVDMTKACIGNDAVFGVCQIVDGREAGMPAVPALHGCTARILKWDVPSPGLFSLVTQGEQVFRVHRHWVAAAGLIRAEVELQAVAAALPLPAAYAGLGRFVAEIVQKLGAENFADPPQLEDSAWVCHRLAEILPLPRRQKLQLLETADPLQKLAQIEQAIRELENAG